MTDEPVHATIEAALAFIGRRIGAIEKTGQNQHFRYRFVEHAEVVARSSPLLHAAGIVVVPIVRSVEVRDIEKGAVAVVTLAVQFRRSKDDLVEAVVAGEGMDTQDKAVSKAITQALKRAYMTVLGLAVNEGLDDRAQFDRTPRRQAP